MTPFGLSLIAALATAFLPWTYALGGQKTRLRLMAILILALDTAIYSYFFFTFGPPERGVAMNLFWMMSFHILVIASAGLIWGILGQGLMRRFLAAPLIIFYLLLALRLCSLGLALTFTPVIV